MALPNTAYRWRGDWVNGDDYYNYDVARSPITNLAYVLDNGNQLVPSVTDPSADANWKLIPQGGGGGGGTPTYLISPSAPAVFAPVSGGDNLLAPFFSAPYSVTAGQTYRITFKGYWGTNATPGNPQLADWIQVYDTLAGPDDFAIYAEYPFYAYQSGNITGYMNLETLYRPTVSAPFGLSVFVSSTKPNIYDYTVYTLAIQQL